MTQPCQSRVGEVAEEEEKLARRLPVVAALDTNVCMTRFWSTKRVTDLAGLE